VAVARPGAAWCGLAWPGAVSGRAYCLCRFDEEAAAGPLAELGEQVAGLDAEHAREVAPVAVASRLGGHDAGDLVSPAAWPGLAVPGSPVAGEIGMP
jgi:hypothetical protein